MVHPVVRLGEKSETALTLDTKCRVQGSQTPLRLLILQKGSLKAAQLTVRVCDRAWHQGQHAREFCVWRFQRPCCRESPTVLTSLAAAGDKTHRTLLNQGSLDVWSFYWNLFTETRLTTHMPGLSL